LSYYLVGVLHDEVFAIRLGFANVNNAAEDAPGVVHVERDLGGEFGWLILLGAQNHVLRSVADMRTRHITVDKQKFSLIFNSFLVNSLICKKKILLTQTSFGLNQPRAPARSTLQVCKSCCAVRWPKRRLSECPTSGATRRCQKAAQKVSFSKVYLKIVPIKYLGIPLVEGLDGQELVFSIWSSHDGVVLATADEDDTVVQVPLAVPVRNRCYLSSLLIGDEWICLIKFERRFAL
jgi:hypothetical protein